jgi:hypothetical protein
MIETRHAPVLEVRDNSRRPAELRGFWAPSDSGDDRERRQDLPQLRGEDRKGMPRSSYSG